MGPLVYFANGPVLLIRAEEERVLFGFWRGQRLREIEPRLKPGGKYEMATLEFREGDDDQARGRNAAGEGGGGVEQDGGRSDEGCEGEGGADEVGGGRWRRWRDWGASEYFHCHCRLYPAIQSWISGRES